MYFHTIQGDRALSLPTSNLNRLVFICFHTVDGTLCGITAISKRNNANTVNNFAVRLVNIVFGV